MMSDQYVFELQYKGKSDHPYSKSKESPLFVIIDGESMSNFSKLQKDLKKCVPPEPFKIQYLDDEDDVVSIDTEDEFKEFAKLAKQRSSRGLLIRLILDSNISAELPNEYRGPQLAQSEMEAPMGIENIIQENRDDDYVAKSLNDMAITTAGLMELKEKIKSELKEEILSEMKNKMNPNFVDVTVEDTGYEEDSDGNLVCLPEKRRVKLLHNQKKLEKKEKHLDTKIDQRLEKLEMKKKKLLEKASFRTAVNNRKAKVGQPCIMSAIQTKESSTLAKRISVGKGFVHLLHILNDGTLTWTNVELRHTWSSMGLEPEELSVKCPAVTPGQEGQVTIKFKAPKTVGAFISYWHMFHQVDSQWQQFGHYISVSGNTKLPKLGLCIGGQAKDIVKKLKQDNLLPGKTYIYNKGKYSIVYNSQNDKDICATAQTYEMNVGEDSKASMLQKESTMSLEASLASAEIAAEMAREAANAAFRRASGTQVQAVSSSTNGLDKLDKINDPVDEVGGAVRALNVVDSSSDTEVNNDTNEDTDPGFVFLEVPAGFHPDGRAPQLEKVRHEVQSVEAESSDVSKEINEMISEIRKNNEDTSADLQVEHKERQEIEMNSTLEKSNIAHVKEQIHLGNKTPDVFPYEKVTESQEPLIYPRIEMFPGSIPASMYAPPQPIPHHHAPHAYPVFQTQNPSHHTILLPPPLNYFAGPKINPRPIHYPQIPNYPIPGSSHPIPLISTGLPPPPAMSAQPAMALPPQMTPASLPQPFGGAFPMAPLVMRAGYDNLTGQETVVNNESKTTNSIASPRTGPNVEQPLENTLSSIEVFSANTATTEAFKQKDAASEQKIITTEEKKHESAEKTKPADAGVQILPQSLVDGAINVAATAYSTAWNALSNLRQKDGETVEFDPVFENNMALLVEMGFNNLERNALLLKRFNNDVSQVIGVICASGGADNINID